MKLNINTTTANSPGEELNIPEERIKELLAGLDKIVDTLAQRRHWGEILVEVSELCNTPEELLFCGISHGIWLSKNGFAVSAAS